MSIISLPQLDRKSLRSPGEEFGDRVRIFGRHPGPWTISWYETEGGPRFRVKRYNYKKAERFARDKRTAIENGELWRQKVTPARWATLMRVEELAAEAKMPAEAAMSKYLELLRQCDYDPEQVVERLKYANENRPAGGSPALIPDLVKDFLAARNLRGSRGRPISRRWAQQLEKQLNRFAKAFAGPVHILRAAAVDKWLDELAVKPITREHYRSAIMALVAFAKLKGALSKSWEHLDQLATVEREDAEIRILAPDQLKNLLEAAPDAIIPFICLTAFAGVRHEEMTGKKSTLLEWRNIDLDARTIYVPKAAAKTGRDRLVPISDNLLAWLRVHRRPSGPVCRLKNSSNALTRAKKKAGIPTKRNETRNTLRKGFISYRLAETKNAAQVAEEAGTSVAKIRSNYKQPISEAEAKRWFSILPDTAQGTLFDWAKGK